MSYEEELLKKLEDDESWPQITKPDLMEKLDGYAEEAFVKPSEQLYISSILIYQQLCEELLKITFDTCSFIIQIQLLPLEYKVEPIAEKMFGQVIKSFKQTIEFPDKMDMITLANKINEKRIQIAHGLVGKYDLSALKHDAELVNKLFFEFFESFDGAQGWLRSILYRLREEKIELSIANRS